jgi:hypothetical protein
VVDVQYRQCNGVPNVYSRHFDGSSCDCYPDQCFGATLLFFRDRKREHYENLNSNVFVWLNTLKIDYSDRDDEMLPKIVISIPKDSIYYNDARKHMSKKMKKNLDNFERDVENCNKYIEQINPTIRERIQSIISQPIHGRPSTEEISSIRSIVKTGYYQAIKSTDNVEDFIRGWDLTSKSGFTVSDTMRNILGAIQQDASVWKNILELQTKISQLTTEATVINNQSKEISLLMTHNRYRAKRICCPSLVKEIWHNIF